MIDRKSFLGFKPKTMKVEIPEFEDYVYVTSLTTRELQEAEAARAEGADSAELLYKQVLCCVCNEDGQPIFQKTDREIVENLPFAVVKRLSEAVNEISGLGEPKN